MGLAVFALGARKVKELSESQVKERSGTAIVGTLAEHMAWIGSLGAKMN